MSHSKPNTGHFNLNNSGQIVTNLIYLYPNFNYL